jgi:hypothetical protein
MNHILAPTLTKLPDIARGAVVISGSHAGSYCGYLAIAAGLRAVILHDAGVGRDAAGIGSLPLLEHYGIAAATVSHLSARIGDAADMMKRGLISYANRPAAKCGVAPGMSCAEAASFLEAAPLLGAEGIVHPKETRSEWTCPDQLRRVVLVDSASLINRETDGGAIAVTGSHGALIGGDPMLAVRADVVAAVFNDAGGGIDEAGFSRLPALNVRGTAGITVAAASARIGDARATLFDGIISGINEKARANGARKGQPVLEVVKRLAMSRRLY